MVEWLRGRPIEVPVVAAGSILMFLLIVARTQGLTREVTQQDERRRLLGRVLQATEDERTRITHDLHDGPVQQLAVLNYDVYRARKHTADLLGQVGGDALMQDLQGTDAVLEGVEKGLGEETRVLRHLMSALRPPVLDNRGFAEALTEHAQRFEQEHGIAVEIGLGLDGRLPAELETVLYRIMQESLTNVAKHAKATRVLMTVDQADQETARLRVRDGGVGFDASNRAQLLREGHFGLAGTGNAPGLPASAALAREHDALLCLDDAHGFGVLGERSGYDPSPFGRRGNAIVRFFGESDDQVVLTAGFSKAYSSLLPSWPAPASSSATPSRWCRPMSTRAGPGGGAGHGPAGPGGQPAPGRRAARPALAPDPGPARAPGQVGGGDLQHLGLPAQRDRLPHPADRGQHRRAGRPPAGRARGARRPLRLPPPHP
jgi:Histidine kinase